MKAKTVLDAVNHLDGNWHSKHMDAIYFGSDFYFDEYFPDSDNFVCTQIEFNQCVQECSDNFGAVPDDKPEYIPTVQGRRVSNESSTIKINTNPPYTQTMADNGELPSVDMECLMINNAYDSNYEKVTINYISKRVCVYEILYGMDKGEYSQNLTSLIFKPLTPPKTDKEILTSDFRNAIHDALTDHDSGSWSDIEDIADALLSNFNIKPLTVEVK